MAFPKIGYRSILSTATLTGTVATGFPLSNLADMKAYTITKAASLSAVDWDADAGSDVPADYIAIAASNLAAENVTLTLKGDTAAHGAPATTVRATIVPADYPASGVFIKEFGSQTLRYWRLSLSAASANAAYIGVANLGVMLTLTENMTASVDPNVEEIASSIERGETGHALGAVTRGIDRAFTLDIGPGGMEWTDLSVANGLNDFWKNHARKLRPFFFHPNIAAPTIFDAYYMMVPDPARFDRPLVGGRYSRRSIALPFRSALAEAA